MEQFPGKAKQSVVLSTSNPHAGAYESDGSRFVEYLNAVRAMSHALAGKLQSEDVLSASLGEVAKIIGAEGASILLLDSETQQMSFYVAQGVGSQAIKRISLPPGAGICGHVARTKEPLIVNDCQNDDRLFRGADQASGLQTRNLLCVPIQNHERLWGVLELINKHEGGFDEHDLLLADVVASQIVLGLANTDLHAKIVRSERMSAIGKTVSGLAHCIKNVLNGIRSGSAVVNRALSKKNIDDVQKGWDVVHRNNDMLSTLVLDMLSLARDAKVHYFPTDINDLTDQICQLMFDRAGERGISITCTQAPHLAEIKTDPTHFYRCLLNLITNAVDACQEGGAVHVRIYRGVDKPRCTISVSDNGEGIPPECRAKLFQEFFTTKGGQGTGLGLPVTRKLINELGGRIAYHTVMGFGTRFVLSLPISNETSTKEGD